MAIARGKESKEVKVILHEGIAALGVLAVNPTRAELNNIYRSNNGSTEEPKYVGTTTAKNYKGEDVTVPQVRISFITRTDTSIARNNNIDAIFPINFFLTKEYNYSNKNGVLKVQVIDKYGRTGWVTSEELKAGAIPEYTIKNGPNAGTTMKANLAQGYRRCYIGEENLVKFLIALINIDRPDEWNESAHTYVMKTNPAELEQSECMLSDIEKYFNGNVKELKDAINFQPNNRVAMGIGVRTAKDGKQYQCAYLNMPGKLGDTRFAERLAKQLEEDAKFGRHPSEHYCTENLREYTVSATDYSKKEEPVNDPFAAPVMDDLPADNATQMPLDVDPFAGM